MAQERIPFDGQETSILHIMHGSLLVVQEHHATLERKLQHNLSFLSSLAAAELVTYLHFFSTGELSRGLYFLALAFAVTYLFLAGISVYALWPKTRGSLPFEPTWPTVKKWWSFGNKTYRYRLLSSYVEIWKENQDLLDDKVRATKRSYTLLVIAIGIILLQAYVYALNAN